MSENHLSRFQPAHRPKDSGAISIWISRLFRGDGDAPWKLDRVITQAHSFSNTLRIKSHSYADAMLHHSLWAAIRRYLPTDGRTLSVLSQDFMLDLPGLSLGSLSITGQTDDSGKQTLMFRFRRAIGATLGLFARGYQPCLVRESECGISTRVLEDLITPVLNLMDFLEVNGEATNADKLAACLKRMKANKRDIEFFQTLIKRYVGQKDAHVLPQPLDQTRAIDGVVESQVQQQFDEPRPFLNFVDSIPCSITG